MITCAPLCYFCKHLRAGVDDGAKRLVTCEAFPDGIPKTMLEQMGDHRRPLAGDRGIQFEPSELCMLEDLIEWDRAHELMYMSPGLSI